MTVTKIKLDLKCDTDGCDNMVEREFTSTANTRS